ncbi:uncharacterized protein LOC134280897 [Saccostrea cucullata]|uniref:uncharacterized protein LOC134280897 n=1 Tax=Saccostrea cuccullata TaxID=36930 RepID=UPI002ED61C32
MGTLSLICLLFSIYQTFGQLNSKEDALQATRVLDSTTSGKVSKVFRDILNQESLVRFSMVQKMQSLMLDVADSKINNEYMKKKLNDVTEELHTVHAKNRRMEEENARLHQELKTLVDQNNHTMESLELLLLKNQTSRLQKENEEIAFDTTEIKKQIEEFNKTFGYLNLTKEEVKKDFQKNIKVLKKEVKENKNSNEAQHLRLGDVKTLLSEHIKTFNESRTVFQQQLEIMNKRMENLEKHDNLSTRIQTVEDNLQKFSLSLNDIRIQLQKIVTAENIAFHALLSTIQENLGSRAAVVFGKVTQNSGNAYNATTGKFTAPEDGLYSFQWTILTRGGQYFHTEIVLNGNIIGYNHVDGTSGSSHWASGTSSAVIKMKKKDEVWIRTHGDAGKFAYQSWSSFTGFKL